MSDTKRAVHYGIRKWIGFVGGFDRWPEDRKARRIGKLAKGADNHRRDGRNEARRDFRSRKADKRVDYRDQRAET